MPPPPDHLQVEMLLKLQRVLADGQFTASYKFALLQALADLAVERGDDSGDAMVVPVAAIAEKFVQYYWRHVVPYTPLSFSSAGADASVAADTTEPLTHPMLRQSTQPKVVILGEIDAAYRRHGGSLRAARAAERTWRALVAQVTRAVCAQPLWKLQTVGDHQDPFLYENAGGRVRSIELRPGVAFTLRRFHGLIQELVRGAWLQFVRGLKGNQSLLGQSVDLYEFLFGSERSALAVYLDILHEIQRGTCFYCGRALGARPHVDHFVPWSRYPSDLAHNFVLADDKCNDSKTSRLADVPHLERWCERNELMGPMLREAFDVRGLLHDINASRAITRWAYALAADSDSPVWRSREERGVSLDPRWRTLRGLGVAA
jgi:hypothetical protein